MSKVTNTTVINVNVTNFQPCYNALGMGQIPPGTSVADGVTAIEKVLLANLQKNWPAKFPVYDTSQQGDGIMEPWSQNVGGTAPACVVQEITNYYNGWELPYTSDAVRQAAIEITQSIASNAGQAGYYYGHTTLAGGGEKLYWGVGYTTAVVIGPPTNATGVIYAFSAVLDIGV
jgi:hypothetical protein